MSNSTGTTVVTLTPDYEDDRGAITDLMNGVELRHVAVITSNAGSLRGNHYHLEAGQYTYVIKGEIELLYRDPGCEVISALLRPGDLAFCPPLTEHAIRFIVDSEILALTTVARDNGGYETDTVRLDVPMRVSDSG